MFITRDKVALRKDQCWSCWHCSLMHSLCNSIFLILVLFDALLFVTSFIRTSFFVVSYALRNIFLNSQLFFMINSSHTPRTPRTSSDDVTSRQQRLVQWLVDLIDLNAFNDESFNFKFESFDIDSCEDDKAEGEREKGMFMKNAHHEALQGFHTVTLKVFIFFLCETIST